jgi:hypothetical protein
MVGTFLSTEAYRSATELITCLALVYSSMAHRHVVAVAGVLVAVVRHLRSHHEVAVDPDLAEVRLVADAHRNGSRCPGCKKVGG